MRAIWAKNPFYSALKLWVDLFVRLSFRRFEVRGVENIPNKGAVIMAANHTNALMDALVVLASTRRSKVFMARADIFRRPTIAKLLRFLRIMPVYRVRDGLSSVRGNNKVFDEAVDVLANDVPLCIFPEGTHRAKHSLLNLSKGVFHIALEAVEKIDLRDVYIVPVGIEYEDFFGFRGTVMVSFGKPINVSQYVAAHPLNDRVATMGELRSMLAERIKELILWLPDDELYQAKTDMIECCTSTGGMVAPRRSSITPIAKAMAQGIEESLAQQSAETRESLESVETFAAILRSNHIEPRSLGYNPKWLVAHTFLGVMVAPFAALFVLLSLPVVVVQKVVCGNVKDRAFLNTARFGVMLVVLPLWIMVVVVVSFCTLPLWWAMAASTLTMVAYPLSIDLKKILHNIASEIKFHFYKKNALQGLHNNKIIPTFATAFRKKQQQ